MWRSFGLRRAGPFRRLAQVASGAVPCWVGSKGIASALMAEATDPVLASLEQCWTAAGNAQDQREGLKGVQRRTLYLLLSSTDHQTIHEWVRSCGLNANSIDNWKGQVE